jgi:hypothetical protein
MPKVREQEEFDWTSVIGKALAFLCLHYADMRSEKVGEQAAFLGRLGLPRSEAAKLLGTTDESLRVLASKRAKGTASKRARSKRKASTSVARGT